jgi:hypothetical protein
MCSAIVLMAVFLPLAAGAASPATESLPIRGRNQTLRVYGTRGGFVAVVASGDGGWIHLGPYVAEFLSSKGYFVVGFDSKAYLSSFTKGRCDPFDQRRVRQCGRRQASDEPGARARAALAHRG